MTRRNGDTETRRADDSGQQIPASPRLSISASPFLRHGAPLSRSTIIIGIVSLLSDISTEMVYPILPIFIRDVLKAPATALGLIEGIANGTSSVATGFSGLLSDRIGKRKPVAFAGYALTALSKPFIAIAAVWQVVLAARFTDRLGKGIRSAPKDALIADSVDDESRGRAYGFERTMDYTGAVVGPLVGLALFVTLGLDRVRMIFLLSAVPATIAALLILSLRERDLQAKQRTQALRLTLSGTTREYKRFLLASGVFGLANSANAFLILRSQGLGLDARWTIIAYALYNAVAALASMPAGVASDRLGRRNLLIVGYLIYAITYGGFGLASKAWVVWPLFAFYGLFAALTDGVGKSLAVDTAGSAGRATAIGVYSMVIGLTQIAASYIGGLLWDKIDPAATFYFGAALAALAMLLLFTLSPATGRQRQSD